MRISTIRDLINELEALAQTHGDDCELRMATQPTYPLESTVACVTAMGPESDYAAELEEGLATDPDLQNDEREAMRLEIERVRATPPVVYICEGRQLGYATTNLWT